jgi:hypothetical protein
MLSSAIKSLLSISLWKWRGEMSGSADRVVRLANAAMITNGL